MPSELPSLKLSADELFSQLKSSAKGLTSADAADRLSLYGPNQTGEKKTHPLLHELLAAFSNPLVLILLMAAGVSASVGEGLDAGIIVAIIALSTTLNLVQTFRSQKAVEELQKSIAPTATALRDGAWQTVRRQDVVPGDVIRLQAGDLVPADCRVLEATDLHLQEAALTGESLPREKRAVVEAIASDLPSDNEACVFLGTSVVSGSGSVLAVRTGRATSFGEIAERLSQNAPVTEFEHGLRKFGGLIMRTVIFLLFFVFLASIAQKRDPLESLLFSVALAVGLTPEFLPMITTITLGRSAVYMAKKGVIVKNLASIQNFGSIDILCSDKTGTLTTGEMTLEKWIDVGGAASEEVLKFACINSRLETGISSPLDTAILAKSDGAGEDATKVAETPFDFERRRVSVVADCEGRRTQVSKGAPEGLLDVCTSYRVGGETKPLDEAGKKAALDANAALGDDGYRVIAVATRDIGSGDTDYKTEQGLTLLGFLAFMDPPVPDALHTIHELYASGVDVKIISGDSPAVVGHVCKEIGLEAGEIVVGTDIDGMTDSALQHVAETTRIFARISPAQKNRIIVALRARGHVVGYMGDGINDAPSLHAADVGISVSNAVDVAKDAAGIILAKPGLRVLHDGILLGRIAFGNVMKYLLMGTSSNFGNMFSMAGATMFLKFLPMLPTQILLNNFLYDLSQVTIPTDKVDRSYLRKPRRWDIKQIRNFMLVIGPISSLFDFLTFYVMLKAFNAGEKEFHTGWFVESLATQVLVIFVIRTMGRPWRSRPSSPLAWTALVVVALSCILPFTPLGTILGFVPLPLSYFGFLALVVVVYLTFVEIVKRLLFGVPEERGVRA